MQNISKEFIWWQGVVEDRDDPLMLGRCRVRILGYHTENKNDIPTESLPWAYQAMPINTRPKSVPVGPTEGTWVMGFFRDGSDCQEPIVTHVIDYGVHSANNPVVGFNDPETNIDKPSGSVEFDVGEINTNRLARGIVTDTLVEKNQDREEYPNEVLKASKGSWHEPKTESGKYEVSPKYPYNYVEESESGHVFEVDDTPGKERLSKRHKSGTFEEIHHDGSMMTKVVKDNYEVVLGDDNIHVTGSVNITSDSRINIKSTETINIQSDNQIRFSSGSHIIFDAVGGVQVNGTYFSTTSGTPIFHGGGSTMVTPTGIPLMPDNRVVNSASIAKLNMAIAIATDLKSFLTQSMGPGAIQSMISNHLGFRIPLSLDDVSLSMLLGMMPDIGDMLPVDLGTIEKLKRAASNPKELAASMMMGMVMKTGGVWAERLANTYGEGLTFMNNVDWAGLQALMSSGVISSANEMYLHTIKIAESSIYAIEMDFGTFDIGETLYTRYSSGTGENLKKEILGEVLEFTNTHMTFLPDGNTFNFAKGPSSGEIYRRHQFFEDKTLYGTTSEAIATIVDTIRSNGYVPMPSKLENLTKSSAHRAVEPENESEWISDIKTKEDLWNAIEETHGLSFLTLYKEELSDADLTSTDLHSIYETKHNVMHGILPRIGSTAIGGITTKDKLFHEMHLHMEIVPSGFISDNAQDADDGLVIRVISPFDFIEWGGRGDKHMQSYKLYFEGIPKYSIIKIYRWRNPDSITGEYGAFSKSDFDAKYSPYSSIKGVDEFLNPRHLVNIDRTFNDFHLIDFLKEGTKNFKWANSIQVDATDIAHLTGEMLIEHRVGNVYPYQRGHTDTWIWDGRGVKNQQAKYIPKETLPYIYSIESPVPIAKDRNNNLVCYENVNDLTDIKQIVWGVVWIARSPAKFEVAGKKDGVFPDLGENTNDVVDDPTFVGGYEVTKKVAKVTGVELPDWVEKKIAPAEDWAIEQVGKIQDLLGL